MLVTSTISNAPLDSLRITELMYHPSDPNAEEIAAGFTDDNDFEFIEIINTHPTLPVNLNGLRLLGGVDFAFPNVSLGPGEYIVVVEDLAAFQQRYGNSANILGAWSGRLSNAGERLTLHDVAGNAILDFAASLRCVPSDMPAV